MLFCVLWCWVMTDFVWLSPRTCRRRRLYEASCRVTATDGILFGFTFEILVSCLVAGVQIRVLRRFRVLLVASAPTADQTRVGAATPPAGLSPARRSGSTKPPLLRPTVCSHHDATAWKRQSWRRKNRSVLPTARTVTRLHSDHPRLFPSQMATFLFTELTTLLFHLNLPSSLPTPRPQSLKFLSFDLSINLFFSVTWSFSTPHVPWGLC